MKINQIISSLFSSDIGMYLRDGHLTLILEKYVYILRKEHIRLHT